MSAGYSGQGMTEPNDNAIVRGNTIINAGNVSIAANSCQDCLVENNLVVNTQQDTRAIMVPYSTSTDSNSAAGTRSIVRNNTVYTTYGGMAAITVGGEGGDYVVANNVVQTPGTCSHGGVLRVPTRARLQCLLRLLRLRGRLALLESQSPVGLSRLEL